MSNNHTSGTWFFGTFRETGASAGIDIGSGNGSNIALVHHQAQDRSALETKANARLIAAAPELLTALQFYANPEVYKPDSVGRTTDITFVAITAIAKATGSAA